MRRKAPASEFHLSFLTITNESRLGRVREKGTGLLCGVEICDSAVRNCPEIVCRKRKQESGDETRSACTFCVVVLLCESSWRRHSEVTNGQIICGIFMGRQNDAVHEEGAADDVGGAIFSVGKSGAP